MDTVEAGTNFKLDDAETWPPPRTFVITNYSESPMYFDRTGKRWWAAQVYDDIYGYDEFYHYEELPTDIYWQPISFTKAPALLIASA